MTTGGTRVLIIDDDKMFCHVIKSYLQEVGMRPTVLNSGAKVVERLPEGFDVVVLDLYMVRETGIDVLIAIKNACPDLPVIIMTGYSSNELRQTTENLGACAYLNKPFSMAELRTAIDNLVGGQDSIERTPDEARVD